MDFYESVQPESIYEPVDTPNKKPHVGGHETQDDISNREVRYLSINDTLYISI